MKPDMVTPQGIALVLAKSSDIQAEYRAALKKVGYDIVSAFDWQIATALYKHHWSKFALIVIDAGTCPEILESMCDEAYSKGFQGKIITIKISGDESQPATRSDSLLKALELI